MTPKSLFNIILKILGIFFIRDFLVLIPQLLSGVLYLAKPNSLAEAVWTLGTTLLIFLAYGLVAYYLVFKTEFVIDKLKLDKGFDQETIPLNIHRSTILAISIIIIGGLLLVEEIPNFCRLLFSYFQERRMTNGRTNPAISYFIASALKIVIGFSLMSNQQQIVNFIERYRRR